MPGVDHPLRLSPHLAERVWAGERLGPGIGEAWDLSVHPHGPCRIENGSFAGRTLAEVAAEHEADFGGPIDLLAKRLDCAENLSVQVHPRSGERKTESWVVLDAAPGAGVYHGFRSPPDREALRRAILDGSLPSLLRFVPLRRGQCVFVPSGTVHAIGKGLFLFELQQSADVTYRLFDWGRDRELHVEAGLEQVNLESPDPVPIPQPLDAHRMRLVECPHFFIDRLVTSEPVGLSPAPRWIAVLILRGRAGLGGVELEEQRTALLPAAAGETRFEPHGLCEVLLYGPTRSSA